MKISILMHERHPRITAPHYLIWDMCDVWREQGHQIDVACGLGRPIRGDIVFLHLDLTVVPQRYLEAVARHPCVVNRRVVDLSKTSFSRNRVRSPDEWDGPVIVKTVRNSGGHPERRLDRVTRLGRLRDIGRARLGALSPAFTRWLDPRNYPIYASARDVPRAIFRNPHLFVERFLPERCGDLYIGRTHKFLGDHGVVTVTRGANPLLKGPFVDQTEEDAPPNVVAMGARLGMEYGKLDYVMHHGEPVLLDVNRTPGTGTPTEVYRRQARLLAPGLDSLCR